MEQYERDLIVDGIGQFSPRGYGGRLGGRLTTRMFRPDEYEFALVRPEEPGPAIALIESLMGGLGRLVRVDEFSVVAVIGAGFTNLNPAVVTVTAAPDSGGGTRLHLRGVAAEGLVKQRAGRKAVARLLAALAPPER